MKDWLATNPNSILYTARSSSSHKVINFKMDAPQAKRSRKRRKKKRTKQGSSEVDAKAERKEVEPEDAVAAEEKPIKTDQKPLAGDDVAKDNSNASKESYFARESFESLKLSANTQKALTEAGFTTMTHIQAKSIPVLLKVSLHAFASKVALFTGDLRRAKTSSELQRLGQERHLRSWSRRWSYWRVWSSKRGMGLARW